MSGMMAKCKCPDGSVREVELKGLDSTWTPAVVYNVCEDMLGVRVANVLNLEDIMVEVEYLRDFPNDRVEV